MLSVQEIIKRWFYVRCMNWLRGVLGLRIHYRTQYQEYLLGPRWYVIRNLRVLWDGGQCVKCGRRKPLEVHHLDYDDRGEGWGIAEFFRLRTVCNDCHDWVHGRGDI